MKWSLPVLSLLVACSGGGGGEKQGEKPAEFVAAWTAAVRPKWTAWQGAEFEAHTHVRENDSSFAEKAAEARAAYEAEVGKTEWLTRARDVIAGVHEVPEGAKPDPEADAGRPTEADLAAVEAIRTMARQYGDAAKEARAKRDREMGQQLRSRDRALPKYDGNPVPADELEGRYRAAYDVTERAALWSAVLSSSKDLKGGYGGLRDTYNITAAKSGWENHHVAMLSPYGMKPDEMTAWLRQVEVAVRPLYRQLHTWVRYELAARFQVAQVPDQLPVHWLDDPLGVTWNGTFRMQGNDPSTALAQRGADGLLRDAEGWFLSVGLDGLPSGTWQKSSLYPADPAGRYQKTPGASTWDIDLGSDIRVLLSATPVEPWMHAAHREFAFAHAYLERDKAGLPAPIRALPSTALHMSLATWADMAASRPSRLAHVGLLNEAELPEETLRLLDDALTWVPYLAFAAGTAANFERDVYEGKLPADKVTTRWWDLALEHQGVVPPETRTERWGDPLFVPAFTDAPGRYFEYALATVIAFQLHEKAATDIGVDPRYGDLAGSARAAEMFRVVATEAGTKDWRKVVEDATGEPPSAEAFARHFEPLTAWLQAQNDTRIHTLAKL